MTASALEPGTRFLRLTHTLARPRPQRDYVRWQDGVRWRVIACLRRRKRVPGSRALAGTLNRTQSHATVHSLTGWAPNHWETKHGNERTDKHDSKDDDDNKHGDHCLLVNAALGCLLTIGIVIAPVGCKRGESASECHTMLLYQSESTCERVWAHTQRMGSQQETRAELHVLLLASRLCWAPFRSTVREFLSQNRVRSKRRCSDRKIESLMRGSHTLPRLLLGEDSPPRVLRLPRSVDGDGTHVCAYFVWIDARFP